MTDDVQQPQPDDPGAAATADDPGLTTLFDDALHMVEISFLCYIFADLREMARNKELEGDPELLKKILDLPCTVWDVHQLYTHNAQKFGQEVGKRLKQQLDSTEQNSFLLSAEKYALELTSRRIVMESMEILFFDDASAEEMVYGIGVDKDRKRITVGFRGSATVQDFLQDSKVQTVSIPNPVAGQQSKGVLVHMGFRDYLYGMGVQTKKDSNKVNKGGKCKVILDKLVLLCREYPGYQLFMTGHSLGGALAILTSFEAAAMPDDQIPKPITCITMGAPKSGNWDFLCAFEELEDQGKVRVLRVENDRDMITMQPSLGDLSCFFVICCQRLRYWHVGTSLKLSPGSCNVQYQQHKAVQRSYLRRVGHDVGEILTRVALWPLVLCCRTGCAPDRGSPTTEHSCFEYMRRLNLHKDKLTGLTLEGVYKDRNEK